jgi:hypothetical protein
MSLASYPGDGPGNHTGGVRAAWPGPPGRGPAGELRRPGSLPEADLPAAGCLAAV